MFVCLGFSSHSRIFHSYGDVTITGEGLQILTYARHLRPLSHEGSLACHTYCDTGHPFIMVISEDPWQSHILPSVWPWSCHYLFLWPRSVAAGIWTSNLPLAGPTLLPASLWLSPLNRFTVNLQCFKNSVINSSTTNVLHVHCFPRWNY